MPRLFTATKNTKNNFCFDFTIYIVIELVELQLAVLPFCTVLFYQKIQNYYSLGALLSLSDSIFHREVVDHFKKYDSDIIKKLLLDLTWLRLEVPQNKF
jgi:hypothetical protein